MGSGKVFLKMIRFIAKLIVRFKTLGGTSIDPLSTNRDIEMSSLFLSLCIEKMLTLSDPVV